MTVTLNFTKPATTADYTVAADADGNLTVTGKVGTAIPLAGTTSALTLIQSADGDKAVTVPISNGAFAGWINTIPATSKKFTYTAAASGAQAVKTITLVPAAAPVSPTPTPTPTPTPNVTPTADPIISIVVTSTHQSGKVTSTTIS